MNISADFPEKLLFLFEDARYKVAYGGRGSGKSWAFARAILLKAAGKRIRVLCTREIQKSIKDSVHRLLSDQISSLGLSGQFQILDTEIRGANGSEIIFAGLANHTVESIKSYEGIDIVWIEEAQTVSKKSWDILIPTIRKPGSEVWVSFNPVLDTDETWVRFVENQPPDSIVASVNWNDNPWFPDVLEQERRHSKESAPEDYDNIWEGKCRSAVQGAIYAGEVTLAIQEGRVCGVPYDPRLKVHAIWDLGWNDAMSIILVQKGIADLRIIEYIEDSFKTLDHYAGLLKSKNLNWGYDWLPHDGNTKDFKTGKSTAEILKAFGRKVKQTPNIGVEPGIRAARQTFARCYFDKLKTGRLVECLKRYRRAISTTTNEPGSPVHDEYSHACLVGDTVIKTHRGDVLIKDVVIGDQVWTPAGWSDVINSGPTKYAEELIEIVTADGRKLVSTPEHKILTQRGFIRANALRYNDRVFNGQELPCILSTFISTATNLGFRETITGEMSGDQEGLQTCTGRFGSFITERFRTDLRCITKMATRLITMFPTLSAYRCMTTSGNTCLNVLSVETLIRQANTPGPGLLFGMGQKKEKSGIQSTGRTPGLIESGMKSLVRIAAKSISRLTLLAPSSATRIVSKRRFASEEGRTLVYDLTVKKNACYLANGVLVSNCDAFRYLGVVADQLRNEDEFSGVRTRAFAPQDSMFGPMG